jgi:hypothetical protein
MMGLQQASQTSKKRKLDHGTLSDSPKKSVKKAKTDRKAPSSQKTTKSTKSAKTTTKNLSRQEDEKEIVPVEDDWKEIEALVAAEMNSFDEDDLAWRSSMSKKTNFKWSDLQTSRIVFSNSSQWEPLLRFVAKAKKFRSPVVLFRVLWKETETNAEEKIVEPPGVYFQAMDKSQTTLHQLRIDLAEFEFVQLDPTFQTSVFCVGFAVPLLEKMVKIFNTFSSMAWAWTTESSFLSVQDGTGFSGDVSVMDAATHPPWTPIPSKEKETLHFTYDFTYPEIKNRLAQMSQDGDTLIFSVKPDSFTIESNGKFLQQLQTEFSHQQKVESPFEIRVSLKYVLNTVSNHKCARVQFNLRRDDDENQMPGGLFICQYYSSDNERIVSTALLSTKILMDEEK